MHCRFGAVVHRSVTRPSAFITAVAALALTMPAWSSAQPDTKPSAQEILDRTGAYIDQFVAHFSEVVAEEHYEQHLSRAAQLTRERRLICRPTFAHSSSGKQAGFSGRNCGSWTARRA